MISIIIPTYNESENIPVVCKRVFAVLKKNKIKGELIIVDDSSPDGTGEIAEKMKGRYKNIQIIHRSKKLGLSSAVLAGFKSAKYEILGAMDADLSHPPEKIPEMIEKINKGCDFVIGSRYVKGGKIKDWNFLRKVISLGALLLAKPLTNINDCVSGFFLIRKKIIKNVKLNPIGYKLCLEILVKGNYNKSKVIEIPYIFINRKKGKAKLNFLEIYNYILHLFGLYINRLTNG